MKQAFFTLLLLLLGSRAVAAEAPAPHWTAAQAGRLLEWLATAGDEGLGAVSPHKKTVEAALRAAEPDRIDAAASSAAIELLQAFRKGCCNASLRTGWQIDKDNTWPDAAATVAAAVGADDINALFAARPDHPFYNALRGLCP